MVFLPSLGLLVHRHLKASCLKWMSEFMVRFLAVVVSYASFDLQLQHFWLCDQKKMKLAFQTTGKTTYLVFSSLQTAFKVIGMHIRILITSLVFKNKL